MWLKNWNLFLEDNLSKRENDGNKHDLSFSQDAFQSLKVKVLKLGIVSEGVNPVPIKPLFLHICSTSLLKTLREYGENPHTENFFIFQSVFDTFGKLAAIFIKFKLSSAYSFSLEESKICQLGKCESWVLMT